MHRFFQGNRFADNLNVEEDTLPPVLGKLFGVRFLQNEEASPRTVQIQLLININDCWEECKIRPFIFSAAWLEDLQSVISNATDILESCCSPHYPLHREDTQMGWVYKDD